jgi:pimeloyl-ACP methyl ester carboxylesterase
MRPVFSGLLLLFLAGCGTMTSSRRPVTDTVPPPPRPPAHAIVFVLDGIGDYRATSGTLRHVVLADGLPLHVERFAWSHGHGRLLADHLDRENMLQQGRRLAEQIHCYQQIGGGPPLPVSLVAHSGGCAVVLAAAERLPPGSLEQIVLLAPSVSADYDLRPALLTTRKGLDVFYSRRDWTILGLGVGIFGTADREWAAAAGRIGFRPPEEASPAAALYLKLRQHPWEPSLARTGHYGGHSGTSRAGFLRACVLPLLLPDSPLSVPPGEVVQRLP